MPVIVAPALAVIQSRVTNAAPDGTGHRGRGAGRCRKPLTAPLAGVTNIASLL